MKTFQIGLMIVLAVPATVLSAAPQAQQQNDSLAAAARRAKEQKKNQSKPTKVWDNDNIPNSPGAISVVGQGTPAQSDSAAPPDAAQGQVPPAAPAAKAGGSANTKSGMEAEVSSDKQQVESLKADLDILQRKYDLDQQMFLKKPNNASDKDGAAALSGEKDQVDAKQQEVEAAQKKVDEAQSRLNSASADTAGATPKPPAPANP